MEAVVMERVFAYFFTVGLALGAGLAVAAVAAALFWRRLAR